MKSSHRFRGGIPSLRVSPPTPGTAPEGEIPEEPAREDLRQLAEDIVKYCPNLARMLIAFRSCPPYMGLN